VGEPVEDKEDRRRRRARSHQRCRNHARAVADTANSSEEFCGSLAASSGEKGKMRGRGLLAIYSRHALQRGLGLRPGARWTAEAGAVLERNSSPR
jgi:hypothetical protein